MSQPSQDLIQPLRWRRLDAARQAIALRRLAAVDQAAVFSSDASDELLGLIGRGAPPARWHEKIVTISLDDVGLDTVPTEIEKILAVPKPVLARLARAVGRLPRGASAHRDNDRSGSGSGVVGSLTEAAKRALHPQKRDTNREAPPRLTPEDVHTDLETALVEFRREALSIPVVRDITVRQQIEDTGREAEEKLLARWTGTAVDSLLGIGRATGPDRDSLIDGLLLLERDLCVDLPGRKGERSIGGDTIEVLSGGDDALQHQLAALLNPVVSRSRSALEASPVAR